MHRDRSPSDSEFLLGAFLVACVGVCIHVLAGLVPSSATMYAAAAATQCVDANAAESGGVYKTTCKPGCLYDVNLSPFGGISLQTYYVGNQYPHGAVRYAAAFGGWSAPMACGSGSAPPISLNQVLENNGIRDLSNGTYNGFNSVIEHAPGASGSIAPMGLNANYAPGAVQSTPLSTLGTPATNGLPGHPGTPTMNATPINGTLGSIGGFGTLDVHEDIPGQVTPAGFSAGYNPTTGQYETWIQSQLTQSGTLQGQGFTSGLNLPEVPNYSDSFAQQPILQPPGQVSTLYTPNLPSPQPYGYYNLDQNVSAPITPSPFQGHAIGETVSDTGNLTGVSGVVPQTPAPAVARLVEGSPDNVNLRYAEVTSSASGCGGFGTLGCWWVTTSKQPTTVPNVGNSFLASPF